MEETAAKKFKEDDRGVDCSDGTTRGTDCTSSIADHYNQRKDSDLKERWKSRNLHQKNFNNWIKSVIIGNTLKSVREGKARDYVVDVMDMCSGKGGDLLKWKNGNIQKLMCIDIAEVSVEQSRIRYEDLRRRHNRQPLFEAEFVTADCTKARIKDLLKRADQQFDITSAQFSFHYSFESLPQARVMMRNAAESLKEGGYFIGTTLDANTMIKRLREGEGMSFGNEVHRVEFELDNKEQIPLFGARYNFYLEGAVDCPEFLVHFPMMNKLAEETGLELMYCTSFKDFFLDNHQCPPYQQLLKKMFALEEYPPSKNSTPTWPPNKYTHAADLRDRLRHDNDPAHICIGTLSSEEWEIASLYQVFAFRKRSR